MTSVVHPRVSILIPCHNEEDNIVPCLEAVLAAVPEAEILVIAGGDDQTAERARQLGGHHPQVRVIDHAPDRGKGHAIRDGIALARAPVMAQFDADLQFEAGDLPALLAPILAGQCDLCIGSRFLPGSAWDATGHSRLRDTGNRLLSGWVSLLTGRRATDVTTGMKAWSLAAIEQIAFRDERYSYEAEIVVRAACLGLKVLEIPVRYSGRVTGASMHRHAPALAKAGMIIALKCLIARLRRA